MPCFLIHSTNTEKSSLLGIGKRQRPRQVTDSEQTQAAGTDRSDTQQSIHVSISKHRLWTDRRHTGGNEELKLRLTSPKLIQEEASILTALWWTHFGSPSEVSLMHLLTQYISTTL